MIQEFNAHSFLKWSYLRGVNQIYLGIVYTPPTQLLSFTVGPITWGVLVGVGSLSSAYQLVDFLLVIFSYASPSNFIYWAEEV